MNAYTKEISFFLNLSTIEELLGKETEFVSSH